MITVLTGQFNQTTYYVSKYFIHVVNSSGTFNTTYVYDEKDLVARKDPDGKKYFYHPDHLGSTSIITNATGAVVEETTYEPFGRVASGGGDRYQYTGKELDTGTGLEYYGARYYDPSKASQFISPDSNLPNVYDPQQLNRYAYARDNPYTYKDPDGNVVVAVNPPIAVFGQNSFSTSQGAQLFSKNQGFWQNFFEKSKFAQTLREAGYRNIDEFPSDSPIHSVADKWKWGGMAKELGEGRWSAFRWDVGKTPQSPNIEIPHSNQQIFQQKIGEQILKGIEKSQLDHFPIFSPGNIVITFDQNKDKSEESLNSINQNYQQNRAITESQNQGSTTTTRTTTTSNSKNNNRICLIICF